MELTKSVSYSSYNALNPYGYGSSSSEFKWHGWGADKVNGQYGFAGRRQSGVHYAFAYRFTTPKWSGDIRKISFTIKLKRETSASCNVICSLTPFDASSNTTSYGTSTVSDSQRIAYTTIDVDSGEADYTVEFSVSSLSQSSTYYLVLSANGGTTNYCTISTISFSGTITYDAAASDVSATNGYFGSTITITTTNDGMLHEIYAEFEGEEEGIISTTESSVTWTVPANWMSLIPNDQSGELTVYCQTEASSTPAEATCTIYVPDNIKPAIDSASISPVNSGAPESWASTYIQNLSKIQATLQAEALYSTIKSWTFNCGATTFSGDSTSESIYIDQTSDTITNAGTFEPTITVTDARGRSTESKLTEIQVLSYTTPTITDQQVYRCTSDGTEDKKNGTYLKAQATAAVSSLDGKNTYTMYFEYKERSATEYVSTEVQSGVALVTGGGEIDVLKAYNARFRIVDQLNTVYVSVVIGSQSIPFHLKPSSESGAGFGGYAQDDKTVELFNGWILKVPDGSSIMIGSQTLEEYIQSLIS